MLKLICAIALAGTAAAVSAQDYPRHPVKLVVPFPAGAGPDQVARILSQQLHESLGQPFVVENRSGALGALGAAEVARSAPDGYTILITTNTTQAANVALFKNLQYDPAKDFAPIIRLITTSMMLMVRSDFPTFADFAVGLAQIKGGKMKSLGVTSLARTPLAPDIPAIAEELPGFETILWYGLVAPAGTPRNVVNRLHRAVNESITKPDIKTRLGIMGLDVAPMSPDQFADYIKSEIAKWSREAKEAGIQPE